MAAFIGAVEYVEETELANRLDLSQVLDQTGAGIARMLLLKRREFEHEKEVRLIHLAADPNGGDFLGFQVDPLELVDEIVLDPRMNQLDVENSTTVLARLDFTGAVTQSTLYKPPEGLVRKLSEVEERVFVSGVLDRGRMRGGPK